MNTILGLLIVGGLWLVVHYCSEMYLMEKLKPEGFPYDKFYLIAIKLLAVLLLMFITGLISLKVLDAIMTALFFGTLFFAKTGRLWLMIAPLGIYCFIRRDSTEAIVQYAVILPLVWVYLSRPKKKKAEK